MNVTESTNFNILVEFLAGCRFMSDHEPPTAMEAETALEILAEAARKCLSGSVTYHFIEEHLLPLNPVLYSSQGAPTPIVVTTEGIVLWPSSGMLVVPALDLDELILAGQRLAELIEEDVEGCECDPCRANDCSERFPAREALATWHAALRDVQEVAGKTS